MNNKIYHEYVPSEVSYPGETLREILEERGISQKALAERMGRPLKTINEIINGKTSITPDTALQLEKVLSASANFWNRRERKYQEYLALIQDNSNLDKYVDWVSKFPIKKMIELNWIENATDRIEQLRILLSYLGVASPKEWSEIYLNSEPKAAFRQSLAREPNPYSVSAWLRYGELSGKEIQVNEFDKKEFKYILHVIREITREEPDFFVPKMKELCAKSGVALIFAPQLPNCRISGATRFIEKDKALLQMSLRYKTDDHFWFTFFHEAGHLLLHGKKDIFLENNDPKRNDSKEKEADKFAAEILIPKDELSEFISQNRRISKATVERFAEKINISPGIVVGRLQHEGILKFSYFNDLKRKLKWVQ